MKTISLIKILPMFAGLAMWQAYASNILPSGAKIIAGDAKIFNDDRTQVIISTKERNVISWEDFSVGSENRVIFDDHKYLNLVHGSKASVIDGKIGFSGTSNSAFYLINPNGITLGKTGVIDADRIVLSTSKITEKTVNDFIDSGELSLDSKGLGKIKLIGKIATGNLHVDGSQIIIRDIEDITRSKRSSGSERLTNLDGDNIILKSSTGRIDIGGKKGLDIETVYRITSKDGLVDHTGETALSTAKDFSKISDNPSGKYFVTNDVELGEISATLDDNKGFTGNIDGAFNSVSYTLSSENGQQNSYGLFSKIDGASVSNLKIKDSSVRVDSKESNVYAGALSGKINDSRIENVEVENFDIQNKFNAPVTIYAGALTGMIENGYSQSEIKNVYTDFSDKSVERFNSHNYYVTGAIAGRNEASTQLSGYIGTDKSDNTSYFGENNSSKTYTEDLSAPGAEYIRHQNGYSNTGFYAPFFVDDDIKINYRKDNPESYEYTGFTDNPYFKTANYVDVSYDYEGRICDPGVYTHTYASKAGGTEFYFVKNGDVKDTAPHYVQVIDQTVIPEQEKTDNSWESAYKIPEKNYSLLDNYLNSGERYKDEEYDHKSYTASLSFFNRMKSSHKRISNRLIASLKLNNAPLDGMRSYAYKREDNEKSS